MSMKLIDQNFRPLSIEEIFKIDSKLADEIYTEKMRGIRNLVDMVFDIVPDKKLVLGTLLKDYNPLSYIKYFDATEAIELPGIPKEDIISNIDDSSLDMLLMMIASKVDISEYLSARDMTSGSIKSVYLERDSKGDLGLKMYKKSGIC